MVIPIPGENEMGVYVLSEDGRPTVFTIRKEEPEGCSSLRAICRTREEAEDGVLILAARTYEDSLWRALASLGRYWAGGKPYDEAMADHQAEDDMERMLHLLSIEEEPLGFDSRDYDLTESPEV